MVLKPSDKWLVFGTVKDKLRQIFDQTDIDTDRILRTIEVDYDLLLDIDLNLGIWILDEAFTILDDRGTW